MIGSTARQSGKTELAAMIIRSFSKIEKITAVKVTTLQEGDASFHKSIALPENTFYSVKVCTTKESEKSTDRMLSSGASDAYWIHSRVDYLSNAWEDFYSLIDKDSYIVCESGSLRHIMEPDVFIMIKNLNKEIKPAARSLLKMADQVIDFNGEGFVNFDIHSIAIRNSKWKLNKF